MKESGFLVAQSVGRVSSEEELELNVQLNLYIKKERVTHVRVLVDGTRDQSGDVIASTKDLRERVAEGRGSLNGGKVEHADVIRVAEAENVSALAEGDSLGDEVDVLVEDTAVV